MQVRGAMNGGTGSRRGFQKASVSVFLFSVAAFVMAKPTSARLVDAVLGYDGTNAAGLPAKLSQTGLYANISLKTRAVSEGILPFEVNAALWSDAAHKERFITVPAGTTIVPSDTDHYAFPDKTVMVKNFAIDTVVGDANSSILIETRFMVIRKTVTGFAYWGISYAWNRDQSDANLVDPIKGLNTTLMVKAGGQLVGKRWTYPSRSQCTICHVGRGSLGFITPQLNRPSKANASINQLADLFAKGVLSKNPLSANPNAMKWAGLDDASASLELRGRSYLAANCSHCHGNGNKEFTGVAHDFDFQNKDMKFIYDPANAGVPGPYMGKPSFAEQSMPQLMYPGHPDSSFILFRMLSRGTFETQEMNQMPPLATWQPDSSALRVLADWICSAGKLPTGAGCKIMDVPQDHYWGTGIARHAGLMRGNIGLRANMQKGYLILDVAKSAHAAAWAEGSESAGAPDAFEMPSLTDIHGKAVSLRPAGDGRYALPAALPAGTYFLRWRGQSIAVNAGI
jgi:hypothetical protein